jgi:hypothetical protein
MSEKFTLDPESYKRCIKDVFDDMIKQCTIQVEGKDRIDVECLDEKFRKMCVST